MINNIEETVTFVHQSRTETSEWGAHVVHDIKAVDATGAVVGSVTSIPCTTEQVVAFVTLCQQEEVSSCHAQDVLEDFTLDLYL